MSDFLSLTARFAFGRKEIKPTTIGLPLGTLPPSFASLGSSWTNESLIWNVTLACELYALKCIIHAY